MLLNVFEMDDSSAHFIAMSNANIPPHPFNYPDKYPCNVIIAADNMTAINVSFVFDWRGNKYTSGITYVSISLVT